MVVGMLLFAQISAACAPGDSVQTLASVAKTESGFDSLVLHDNTTGDTIHPKTGDEAKQIARQLIAGQGHSVDVGLMQINSADFNTLGLSIDAALDSCQSVAAGAKLLRDGYRQALRVAFSRYNTGDAERGFANGYVRRVEASSLHLPAIETARGVFMPAPAPAAIKSEPAVVLDMLHSDQVASDAAQGAGNLLSGVALVGAAEPDSRLPTMFPHPAS